MLRPRREASNNSDHRGQIVATRLPRIAITVPRETHAALDKLSRLQRRPRSAVAADLLEEMTPALERIASLLEAATKARDKLPASTVAKLSALEELLGHTAQFGLDRLAAAIGTEAQAPAPVADARRRRAPPRRGH